MQNLKIRREARIANIPLWMIGRELGYSDSYFSRKLRNEFPEEERDKVIRIIKQLGREMAF